MCLNDTDYFNAEYICVANSSDLTTWTKPKLPYFPWDGDAVTTRKNEHVGSGAPTNRIYRTDANENMGTIIIDESTGIRRFLLVWENTPDRHLYIAQSPDGLGQWTR